MEISRTEESNKATETQPRIISLSFSLSFCLGAPRSGSCCPLFPVRIKILVGCRCLLMQREHTSLFCCCYCLRPVSSCVPASLVARSPTNMTQDSKAQFSLLLHSLGALALIFSPMFVSICPFLLARSLPSFSHLCSRGSCNTVSSGMECFCSQRLSYSLPCPLFCLSLSLSCMETEPSLSRFM